MTTPATADLLLRPVTEADAPAILEAFDDPLMSRQGTVTDLAQAQAYAAAWRATITLSPWTPAAVSPAWSSSTRTRSIRWVGFGIGFAVIFVGGAWLPRPRGRWRTGP